MKQLSTKITDTFWNNYRQLVKDQLIPYQWAVINDEINVTIQQENANTLNASEKSHAIQNLKIAAGLKKGKFYGFWFQDSDVYKWLEATAYALRYAPDKELQNKADSLINLIAKAQEDDGYLDTYFQLESPDRKFKHVSMSHELYCMGHYIEAGVAYYQTTHNQQALDIAIKMANCIDHNFGPETNKLHGYPGHPELELALAKLAEVTADSRYTDLAAYMIDQRGTEPNFFTQQALERETAHISELFNNMDPDPRSKYFQNQKPVREMDTAEGHAVRMVYLLTGIAHVARQNHDQALIKSCQHLWQNIINKQMYVTGGIGSTVAGEAFTFDYDLPNDTMYCETCASCAMTFFAKQMQELEPNSDFTDIIERELFNGTISGMSLDGKHFFYVNPLEVNPEASAKDPTKSHVKVQRADWFGCACCPPNLARLVASVDQYLYTTTNDTIFCDQFISNTTNFDNGVKIKQTSQYPWSGKINFTITATQGNNPDIAIRIPCWSIDDYQIKVNQQLITPTLKNGYWYLTDLPNGTTNVVLTLNMSVRQTQANPLVTADVGKVAIERGPLVYCLEEVDNGPHLAQFSVTDQPTFATELDDTDLPIKFIKITTHGEKLNSTITDLYSANQQLATQDQTLTFIPYFAWANRTPGEMQVWINRA